MAKIAHSGDTSETLPGHRILLLRVGLPGVIALAGVVLLILGGTIDIGLGLTLIGISFIVVLVNVFVRLSFASEDDRAKEEAAREHFTKTGRWPS